MVHIARSFFERSVENIANWGDTDVFPFPFDGYVFKDNAEAVVDSLVLMESRYEGNYKKWVVTNHSTLSPVSYTGFRWATQIDPVWNAYLLALVLSVAEKIEQARIPVEDEVVFSYRYDPQQSSLFRRDGWKDFQSRCSALAEEYEYVVTTDIADFYPRVYHHRLDNALQALGGSDAPRKRIGHILGKISSGASYGLPVGGPAARILSELTLNQIDKLLLADSTASGYKYCRFADDFRIFVKDLPSAYRAIGLLADKLSVNQGLSLQKSKTSVVSAAEYKAMMTPESPDEGVADFLSLHLHFDPYSTASDVEYEELAAEVSKHDISGMLSRELGKSQIDSGVTRKLVGALRFIEPKVRAEAIVSLLEVRNFERLAPILPRVLLAIRSSLDGMERVDVSKVCALAFLRVQERHYLTSIELNLAYLVRLIGEHRTPESITLLSELYKTSHGFGDEPSPVIQRDIVLIMARWGVNHWLSDMRPKFDRMHLWVQRAFTVASLEMGDEGDHWRSDRRRGLEGYEMAVFNWAAARKSMASSDRVVL